MSAVNVGVMNGTTSHIDILHSPGINGTTSSKPTPPSSIQNLSEFHQALDAVYSPLSTNDRRKEATAFLEEAKRDSQAPQLGYRLASDRSQPSPVRHYGLSLLEYPIKYKWEDLGTEESAVLRTWVIQLAQGLQDTDAAFLRNKVAQLWEEVGKKSWMIDWLDMDTLLVELWQGSIAHKALVLYVLETLSEDVFNREDAAAALRGNDLANACVNIFTPAAVLRQHYPRRGVEDELRCGEEGWIDRLCNLLDWCLDNNPQGDERVHSCALKVLAALKASMTWIMPKALHATRCLDHLCKALSIVDVGIQMVVSAVHL